MYHIKLIKSRSYKGVVSATKAKPDVYVEDKAIADKAVVSGFFKLIEGAEEQAADAQNEAGTQDNEPDNEPDYEGLEEMTKAELTDYAEKNGISIEGCSTKAQILEAISAASGGSAAVIDLQK